MWHLIKKDILLCRVGIVFILLINIFFGWRGLIFMTILRSETIISTFMLCYVLFMGLFLTLGIVLEREKKVDGDIILHSIPIDKNLIVTSRYASSLLFLVAYGLILCLYPYILKYTHGFNFTGFRIEGEIPDFSIYSLLTALSIIIVFLSFYLVLYYSKLSKGKSLNTIAYFLIVILPAIVFRFKDNIMSLEFIKYINLLDKKMLALISFVTSLILYWVSMEVSKRNYSK